jgi:DNA processing protein
LEEDAKYWVALNLVVCENLKLAALIRQRFSDAKEIFQTTLSGLISAGLDRRSAVALSSPDILRRACREIEWLEKKKYNILTVQDEMYPKNLREIFDPPLVLYYAGKIETLAEPAISIVGARKSSPYGRAVAERLAHDLALRGLVVVSGLARGIDSVGHWGALKGGKTIAVLGSGLGRIYPRENRPLFEKIVESGIVLTEYPSKSPPLGFHFPLRNRIISGLSLALVVIEATRKSGSLISAKLALEENREVMAVPGNITSELSPGVHSLIKSGAKLVEDWRDVAEELPLPWREKLLSEDVNKKPKAPILTPEEKRVYNLLPVDALTSIDELVEKSDLSVSELFYILLNLELHDLVSQRPGKLFQRKL